MRGDRTRDEFGCGCASKSSWLELPLFTVQNDGVGIQRQRRAKGWPCGLYRAGAAPAGVTGIEPFLPRALRGIWMEGDGRFRESEEDEGFVRGVPAVQTEHARVFEGGDLHLRFAEMAQRGRGFSHPQKFAVEVKQRAMGFGCLERMVEPGVEERGLVLRIWRRALPCEGGEFALAATADGLDEVDVGVADKVEEGRGFAVLLAHEEQRQEWREDDGGGGELELLEGGERGETFAEHAIADLIVILNADGELPGGNIKR